PTSIDHGFGMLCSSVCREIASRLDSRRGWYTITAMRYALVLIVLCSGFATAARPNDAEAFRRAGIEPIVAPADYRAFMADLQLDRDQMEAADLLLDDYASGMRQVLADLRAQQERDRQRLDAALEGKIRLSADAIRELRMSLRGAVQDSWRVADERMQEMVEWATLLSQADAVAQARAIGRFHRRVYLTGHGRAGLVDVAALAADAAELQAIDEEAVRSALAVYDQAIATTAKDDALAVRESRITDVIASLRGDVAARASLQRASAARWRVRMTVQDAGIAAITALVSSRDADAVRRWSDRVNAAFFPSVYGPLNASIAAEWIAKNGDAAQVEKATACIDDSMDELRSLRGEAVTLLREGRELGVDLDHDAASLVSEAMEVRMRYLRNSGERSVLEQEMFACVVRPLSDGQKAAIRRILMMGH
ncbi:MAG: hypothetical protein QGH76_02145, partial [Phycisphaerales bacterium]|nr:hypothetical protein [Phycisphaerales bacterium]